MTDSTPAPQRSWKGALLASLALNLFLVGLIGGQALFGPEEEAQRPNTPRGYSLHPRIMRQALPEARHDDIRAFAKDARKDMRRDWQEITDIRRDIDTALRAVPFDPATLHAAQKREVDARALMRQSYNEQNSAFLATLTDEERDQIADLALANMEKQIAYWRERRSQREAARKAQNGE